MVSLGAVAAVIAVRVRDVLGHGGVAPVVDLPTWQVVGLAWGVPILVTTVAWYRVLVRARRLDRTGDVRETIGARRWVSTARWAALVWCGVTIFGLGWVEVVRAVVGDWPLVDELLVASPTLFALAMSLAAWHPIELRVREAVILRELDLGGPVYAPPTLGAHVARGVRFQMFTLLVPLCMIMLATDAVDWLAWWAMGPARAGLPAFASDRDVLQIAVPIVQLLAAITAITLTPPVLRVVWGGSRLGPGPTRDLVDRVLARHDVRVRQVIVWPTGGAMVNAAVVGVAPSLRYLILTDGLLDHLAERELEAVVAHEVGHLKRRHVPWLAAVTLSVVLVVGGCVGLAITLLPGEGAGGSEPGGLLAAGPALGAVAITLLTLGFASRRFEWQADAFAACHFASAGADRVGDEGVSVMAGALGRVARLNGSDPRRFSWRHGSIRDRQRRLMSLVGVPINALPQDRTVDRIKRGAGFGIFLGLALVVAEITGVLM
jgi:STE24 endopeptidase